MQQEVEETQVDEEPLATQNLHTSAVHAPVPSTDPSSTGPSENPSANHSSSAVQASPALSGQPVANQNTSAVQASTAVTGSGVMAPPTYVPAKVTPSEPAAPQTGDPVGSMIEQLSVLQKQLSSGDVSMDYVRNILLTRANTPDFALLAQAFSQNSGSGPATPNPIPAVVKCTDVEMKDVPPENEKSADKTTGDNPQPEDEKSADKTTGDNPKPEDEKSADKTTGDNPKPEDEKSADKTTGDNPKPEDEKSADPNQKYIDQAKKMAAMTEQEVQDHANVFIILIIH